jgi:protein involved in polysaccharide export with SLBB domain
MMKIPAVFGILMLFTSVSTVQGLAAAQSDQTAAAYHMAPGDTIEVRYFFNPELNEQVQIRPDGRISLQLIGEVTLSGRTVSEAVAMINESAVRVITTPSVSIQVRSFAGLKVFVTGEVTRPGPIALPGQMTLVEAIGEAGGRRPTAGKTVVVIRRNNEGRPEGVRLSPYRGDREGPDAAFALQPFDVVMVPESKVTRLDRWVDQHIKQLNPVMLSAGFTYLLQRNPNTNSAVTVPVF